MGMFFNHILQKVNDYFSKLAHVLNEIYNIWYTAKRTQKKRADCSAPGKTGKNYLIHAPLASKVYSLPSMG